MPSKTDHIDSDFDESDELAQYYEWRRQRADQANKIHDLIQKRDRLKAELKIRSLNKEIEKLENLLDEESNKTPYSKNDYGFFINFLAKLTT